MLWDTAGQEEFDAITKAYYRGAQAAVLAFSTVDRVSFDAIRSWKKKVRVRLDELAKIKKISLRIMIAIIRWNKAKDGVDPIWRNDETSFYFAFHKIVSINETNVLFDYYHSRWKTSAGRSPW